MKDFNWNSVGLDFGDWDEKKVWGLELPIKEIPMQDLLWHFDVPFWTNDDDVLWTVSPWDTIHKKEGTKNEQDRIECSDLKYPIDILENHGRWLVLDGLHRLAKAYQLKQKQVKVRVVPREFLPKILKD